MRAAQTAETRSAHLRAREEEDAAAALTAGILQGGYRSTALKRDAKPSALRHVTVFTLGSSSDIDDAVAEATSVAQGTALARCVPHCVAQASAPRLELCESVGCGRSRPSAARTA